ncbi:Cl-like repressor [Lactococcus phage 49801]|nr:Cl-like repressor [Lactococcus phage 49801]
MENILKEKRLEKKLTLEQVGEIVGVGKSTVRKWENGMIENMGRDKIVSLSKALGISPLDILGIGDSENKTDPIKKEPAIKQVFISATFLLPNFLWFLLDSNQRPNGYEPLALTN